MYQITNMVNSKIYVGVHTTTNLNDGYMGSGKIIRAAIKKHGIINFRKDILEMFDNAALMFEKETEVVNDEFLLRDDVYNIRRGGHGGFDHISKDSRYPEWTASGGSKNTEKQNAARKYCLSIARIAYVKKLEENNGEVWWENKKAFRGKIHTTETKEKLSLSAKARLSDPTKNSQYGKIWITDGTNSRSVPKDAIIPEGWYKGRILKKK